MFRSKILTFGVLFIFFLLAVPSSIYAFTTSNENYFIPNNSANKVVKIGQNIYVQGNNISYVGPNNGKGFIVDLNSGAMELNLTQTNLVINAAVPDGSGGWYVGGGFTIVDRTTVKNNIAHIKSDGTLDVAWNVTTDGPVSALVLKNNILYIGGNFTNVNSTARNFLAAINATSGELLSWEPNPDGEVKYMAANSTNLYVTWIGGSISGSSRNGLAAFNLASRELTAWDPNNPDGSLYIRTLAVDDSSVYVGGSFFEFGGQSRQYVAILDATTGTVNTIDLALSNGTTVYSLVVDNTNLYVGGDFTDETVNGELKGQPYIVSFNKTTGAFNNWNPNVNGAVTTLALSGTKLIMSGSFSSVSGSEKLYIASVDKNTADLSTWTFNSKTSYSLLVTAGSKLFLSGNVLTAGPSVVARSGQVYAIDADTGKVTNWNPVFGGVGYVSDIISEDGLLYVTGEFDSVNGQERIRLAVFDSSGNLTSFKLDVDNVIKSVKKIGNTLYIGGFFTTIGGQTRNGLAAVNATTAEVLPWDPSCDTYFIYSLELKDTTLYVGGDFTSIGGQARNNIASFDTNTGLVNAWDPNASSMVKLLYINDTTLYVAGNFSLVAGQDRNNIASFETSTGNLTSWNPSPNWSVQAVVANATKIYVGGTFTNIGGQDRNRLAEFDASTGQLTSWNPNLDSSARSIVLDGSTMYIAGAVDKIGDKISPHFGVFSFGVISAVASSNSGTNTTITWDSDVAGSSIVDYGLTNSYGSTTETQTTPRVTSHSVVLTNLASCTKYYYRVRSKNADGDVIIGPENSFTSGGCVGNTAILEDTNSVVTTAAGGELELLDNKDDGVLLTIPSSFSSDDATFQIKKVSASDFFNSASYPSGYNAVANYVYNLKALSNSTTTINSFENPITVTIAYDHSDLGSITEGDLTIYRYDDSNWHPLSNCTVDSINDKVSCTTTAFSTFALLGGAASPTATPTSAPAAANSTTTSTSDSGSTSTSGSGCNNIATVSHPDLFEIRTNKNSATLFFTPPPRPYSSFYISYSAKPNQWEHDVQFNQGFSSGVVQFTVNSLKPNTKYYFKIRAQNGCMTGQWGNTMTAATTSSSSQKIFYKNIISLFVGEISKFISVDNSKTKKPKILKPEKELKTQPKIDGVKELKNTKKNCFLWWCF